MMSRQSLPSPGWMRGLRPCAWGGLQVASHGWGPNLSWPRAHPRQPQFPEAEDTSVESQPLPQGAHQPLMEGDAKDRAKSWGCQHQWMGGTASGPGGSASPPACGHRQNSGSLTPAQSLQGSCCPSCLQIQGPELPQALPPRPQVDAGDRGRGGGRFQSWIATISLRLPTSGFYMGTNKNKKRPRCLSQCWSRVPLLADKHSWNTYPKEYGHRGSNHALPIRRVDTAGRELGLCPPCSLSPTPSLV